MGLWNTSESRKEFNNLIIWMKRTLQIIFNIIIIKLFRLFRYLLRLIFNFDRWHISTLYERRYAQDIIYFLNQLNSEQKNSVVEIGCGLGDIVRNLKFKNKIGFDKEENVLKAARFINYLTTKRAKFSEFNFPSYISDKHNVIIMVNWIHHIKPELLKEAVANYFDKNILETGCIILDTVQEKNYEFNHDINYLTSGLYCNILKIGTYENHREVFAICKS